MVKFENISNDNFFLYAAKAYNTPNCVINELDEDLKRLKYLKRLFKKFNQNGELKERLILNHIIILSNVFGAEAATRILFFKIDPAYYPLLKTFLVFLNLMPDIVSGINYANIKSTDIPINTEILEKLKSL